MKQTKCEKPVDSNDIFCLLHWLCMKWYRVLNWYNVVCMYRLQGTFEAKKGSCILTQAEVFADYQQFCRKFGVADTLNSADFVNIVQWVVVYKVILMCVVPSMSVWNVKGPSTHVAGPVGKVLRKSGEFWIWKTRLKAYANYWHFSWTFCDTKHNDVHANNATTWYLIKVLP